MKKNIFNTFKNVPIGGFGIVLIFLVLVILSVYFFTRSTEHVEIRMFLTEREWAKTWENYPDYFYIQNLSTDLVEKDELGRTVARVTEIHSNRLPHTHNQALATIELRANYNKKTGIYSFQGKPLIIGDYQRLRVGNMRLQGYILDIGSNLDSLESKHIKVKVSLDDLLEANRNLTSSRAVGVSADLVPFLKVGASILGFENEPILEILDVNLFPGQRTLFERTGAYTVQDDSLVSGSLLLKLEVNTINEIDYWNFTDPIQLGKRINLNFENAIVPVKIVEILDE